MLAAVYHGPGDLRVETVPTPVVGPGEILLRVKSASICGTDLRIFHGDHRKYPPGTVRIPGHEVVGTVAELGAEVTGFVRGQRVFIAPNIGCGHCRQCISGNNNLCANFEAIGITLDGGFAEYLRVPAQAITQGNVFAIADRTVRLRLARPECNRDPTRRSGLGHWGGPNWNHAYQTGPVAWCPPRCGQRAYTGPPRSGCATRC